MSSPLPQHESSRLEVLRSFQILDTSPELAFDDIVLLATLICDTPIGKIGFVDQHRVWLKAKIGLEFDEIPRERSFSAHAILRPDPLLVADPLTDVTFANSLLVREIGVRFFAGIPLITSSHHAIGVLGVMDRVPHLMTAEQIDSLQILARRIMHELNLRHPQRTQSTDHCLHLAPTRQPSAVILLVEDEDNLRTLLRRTLEAVGFTILSASDGAEALGLFYRQNDTINLVITDIVMPRVNGLEFSARILRDRPETKFLFITGYGDDFPELAALNESGTNILVKPFLPSELLRRVEDILDDAKSVTGTEG